MRISSTCAVCGADHRPIEITPEGSRIVDPMSIIGHTDFTPLAMFGVPTKSILESMYPAADPAAASPPRSFPFWGYE